MPDPWAIERPPASAAGCSLPFDPATDGFGFPNRFTWTDDDLLHLTRELRAVLVGAGAAVAGGAAGIAGGRRAILPGALAGAAIGALLGAGAVRGLARRWTSFGLCGGMAMTAVDRWPHATGTPTAELDREEIRDVLRRRQAATLRVAGARFLGYWLGTRLLGGSDVAPPFGNALAGEVAKARERIDAGRPVILGLVGDAPDPFEMHQVVAYGYRAVGDATRFDVYDPNAPARSRHVTAAVDDVRTQISTDLPTGPGPRGYHLSKSPGRLGMIFVVR